MKRKCHYLKRLSRLKLRISSRMTKRQIRKLSQAVLRQLAETIRRSLLDWAVVILEVLEMAGTTKGFLSSEFLGSKRHLEALIWPPVISVLLGRLRA